MKSKVLVVYYEPQRGGQTTHVLNLVRGLDKNKFEITLVFPMQLFQDQSVFSQIGITSVSLPMKKLLWNPKSIVRLFQFIRQKNFDIVHVHSQEAGVMARFVAKIAGAKKIVYTPQCTNIRHKNLYWLYRVLEKLFSYFTDMIISVSEYDRERIIQWGIPPSKVVTIYNAIESEGKNILNNCAAKVQSLGLDDKAPLVMQVGRLSHQKNPLMFIEGASKVTRQIPECQFVLIGEGPLRDEVESYIQVLGIEENVFCLGWQENAKDLIALADIITLTSRWEGLPHVLLEAMACSRPIISTQVNGCSELVQHGFNGYLVPENDVDSWVSYVLDLLKDQEKAIKMGESGKARLKEMFSFQQMINKTEKLYDNLVADQVCN